MSEIPREHTLDSTLAFLNEGYRFTTNRCELLQSDVFETRLMLQRIVCGRGEAMAQMFYEPGRFTRRGALPMTSMRLLQTNSSVLALDGTEHKQRKALFLSVMSAQSRTALVDCFVVKWKEAVTRWEQCEQIVLHTAVQEVLCRATCEWAGVPLAEAEVRQRTKEFAAMIEGAGSVGSRLFRALPLRYRNDHWARHIINAVRAGELNPAEDKALYTIAWQQDVDGQLLDPEVAAIELINLLRPTVAVANFITFAAMALHRFPELQPKLHGGGAKYAQLVAQEVRRYYPFFPAVAGRVLSGFEWRGHAFQPGDWVMLDLYGTNHDAATWNEPESFVPERFLSWEESAYNFIAQGGGKFASNHRCPGEWATIDLIKTAVLLLNSVMHYHVPEQDLQVDLSRLPALPASRFVIDEVRAV